MIDEKKLIEDVVAILTVTDDTTLASMIMECIENQPQADKWIPCEERLPKSNGVYQTVRKVMEGNVIYYLEGASYFDGSNTWHNDIGVNHGREYPNVIAWQPIQPYKKEGAENE